MRKKSKVLHVLKYYRPMFTGEGVFLERSSAFMQCISPQIEHDLLVTSTHRPEKQIHVCSTIQNVFYLTDRNLSSWKHEYALIIWLMRNVLRYQTIHVRTHADWYFIGYIIAKLLGRRLVLSATLDDSVPALVDRYRPSLRPIVRRLFRLFDAFISINPTLHAETSAVVSPEKCHLLPCGIDVPPADRDLGKQIRRKLGIPADALVLIFVGGLCERKDPMFQVLQMPAILDRFPQSFLLLVGPDLEPDYVAEIREQIRASGIEDRVIFTGEVQNPHPLFDAADIMTFSSKLEGFGTVVPEAMGHGLPVVVRHLPGVNDMFVTHGETGFFFTDGEGYRDAVLRLAADADLRAAVGERANRSVRQKFDMGMIASRYLEIYDFPPKAVPSRANDRGEDARPAAGIGTSASILNPRFHAPATFDPGAQPLLATIVDAEEAFDWRRPFSRSATDVRSMAYQHLAHRVFDRHGVIPTYMVDYPVASQEDGRKPLLELFGEGRCDIGAQLHPWVTPPFVEDVTTYNSYPGNLPTWVELAKLDSLTKKIEENFNIRPRIYRAGRYGVGPRTGDILRYLGYEADTSVMPGWDFGHREGPDFSAASATPYWIDAARSLLEIPCSSAVIGRLAPGPLWARRGVFSQFSERLGVPSLMAHLGLAERIKLTPEGMPLPAAKRLVRDMRSRGCSVFVLTYHTPSLVPGNTPYVQTPDDLRRFLAWLEEFYDFFTSEIGGRCVRWQDIRASVHSDANEPARDRIDARWQPA